jgi:nitrite reductase (NADH) small subunit
LEIDTMKQAENLKVEEHWIDIGTISDIPRQGARVVRTADGDIAVFRTADDEVFALRDKCPHKGGPLSQGIVHGRRVACPLHDWKIHLDSGLAVAPDEGCAARFPVSVADGRVLLSLTPEETSSNALKLMLDV